MTLKIRRPAHRRNPNGAEFVASGALTPAQKQRMRARLRVLGPSRKLARRAFVQGEPSISPAAASFSPFRWLRLPFDKRPPQIGMFRSARSTLGPAEWCRQVSRRRREGA
jgi:hypothetical protein